MISWDNLFNYGVVWSICWIKVKWFMADIDGMNEKLKKHFFLSIGCLAMSLGFIGLFLPLMPTTCFMILAVWAFSKSKPELARWILQHPRFGPTIDDWIKYKTIDQKTKCKISLSIVFTFSLSLLVMTPSFISSALMLSVMLVLLAYINSRNERDKSPRAINKLQSSSI